MVSLSLENKNYLITGGGSGIGKGVAIAVAAAGGNVTIMGRTRDKLVKAIEEIQSAQLSDDQDTSALAADVTDEGQVRAALDRLVDSRGRLDGVVHCAGGSETIGPLTQIDSAAWRRTVDLNINGTMYVLKHAAAHLVRGGGGSFVGISSIAASNTHRWFGAYGVSKTAHDHLLQLAADELGASRVRVNGIRPGLTRTELVSVVLDTPSLSEDYRNSTPLPRIGEVEDVAALAVFLLSDSASWITGQLINVDGGQMLRRGPDFTSLMSQMFGEAALRGVVE
jgi:NAD(P)-dependent dehydrogenase (short-subunit alcohol dehydrogenase family)